MLSWIGWGLLMGASMAAQIINFGWKWSLLGIIFSTIGCFAIALAAFLKGNFSVIKRDWLFLFLGFTCIGLYYITEDPWLTTIYSVTADLAIGIPTIVKTIQNRQTEKTHGWTLSLISWSLTLTISFHHDILFAVFPIYLFSYSLMTVFLIRWRR